MRPGKLESISNELKIRLTPFPENLCLDMGKQVRIRGALPVQLMLTSHSTYVYSGLAKFSRQQR
jgi:hypothetical protein